MARFSRQVLILISLMIGATVLNAQNMQQESKNLKMVLDWYREVITFGHVDMASKYMADNYMEHDPNLAGGRKEFVAFYGKNPPRPIQASLPTQPAKSFAKGDYVVLVWEHPDKDAISGTPYSYFTYDVVHVKDGKIQEHWSSLPKTMGGASMMKAPKPGTYPVPEGIPMAGTYDASSLKYTPAEKKNIDIAVGYYRDVVQSHHHEMAWDYLAKDEIQHNPNDPTTPQGLLAWFNYRAPKPDPLRKELTSLPDLLIAKGDMILFMYNRETKDPQDPSKNYMRSRFEMVRMENGKVKEHWDVADRKSTTRSAVLDWCIKAGRNDCPKP